MEQLQEHQKAIDYIVTGIRNGEIMLGSKLPSEREIAERIGISRGSTREAISILRGMGLVESVHGSGNYVANNTVGVIKKVVDIMIALGSVTSDELFAYRLVISRAVDDYLIENGISSADAMKIQSILDRMETATDEEFCRLDREFHLGLIAATGNTLFTTVMEPMGELYMDMIVDVIMDADEGDRAIRVDIHRNIFDSIMAKDSFACAKHIKEHFDFVRSRLTR